MRIFSTQFLMQQKSPYKFVEYLESTGSQYIDTEYIPNSETSVEIDFQYAENITNGRLFGIRTASPTAGGTDAYFLGTYSATGGAYYVNYGREARSIGDKDGSRHKWYINKNRAYFDNAFIVAFAKQTFECPDSAIIFGAILGGVPAYTQAKVYSCRIWDNDTLVRELKPCIRTKDNKAGMYDAVSKQFFENKGTGEFIVGE